MNHTGGKITLSHLSKDAVVYIRQSTMRQVKNNEESTFRQYGLKNVLVGYGWPEERIQIIDSDLGISGAHADNREGFQRLVNMVANEKVGAIAVIEVSRLSRNSSDWAKVIEYCAITNTLIIDEDGIYNPCDPNDRLLLGVKGSITEMELHYIRARMEGGLLNKAVRGDLKIKLPIGYVYNPLNKIVMDPDPEVQNAVSSLFNKFTVIGSINGTVRYYHDNNISFPFRYNRGENKGELKWEPLTQPRAKCVLTNPIYSGRYVFGRAKTVTTPLRKTIERKDEKEWIANISAHHPAYISEEEYERNQKIIAGNAAQCSTTSGRSTTPGRGSALLQGIVYCGNCGRRMNVNYQVSNAKEWKNAFPIYVCNGDNLFGHHKRCMQVNGLAIDDKISELIKKHLNEEAIKNALEIKEEVQGRWNEVEQKLKKNLERAIVDANRLKRMYMQCDLDNKLVRIELENAYNDAISAQIEAEKMLEEEEKKHTIESEEQLKAKLDNLVTNFGSVWDDPNTDIKIKKRLVRQLIQNVTLQRISNQNICSVKILFSGGLTEEFNIMCNFYGPGLPSWRTYEYLEKNGTRYKASDLAKQMNDAGLSRPGGGQWTANSVIQYMAYFKIKTMKQHYLELGYIPVKDVAAKLGITSVSVRDRIKKHWYDGKYIWVTDNMILFAPEALLEAESEEPNE